MKRTAGRPDIGFVFYCSGDVTGGFQNSIGNLISKIRDCWSHKDLECTLVTDVNSGQLYGIQGVNCYRAYVERPEQLNGIPCEVDPSAVEVVIQVDRDNIAILPHILQTAVERGYRNVSHRLALHRSEWSPDDAKAYLQQLGALYTLWSTREVSYYLFDSFYRVAQCRGATWGCSAGRARACVFPDGTQLPCYLFSTVPELAQEYVLGDALHPFGNLEARRALVMPQPPSQECISCGVGRYCFGGCYLHRRKQGTAEFTRNPVFCTILNGELMFLKDKGPK